MLLSSLLYTHTKRSDSSSIPAQFISTCQPSFHVWPRTHLAGQPPFGKAQLWCSFSAKNRHSMSSNPENWSQTDESIREAAFWGTDAVKVWKSLLWAYTTSLKLLADEDALLHPLLEATEIQLCTARLDPSPRLKEESEGLVPLHLHCTYSGEKSHIPSNHTRNLKGRKQ